MGKMVVAQPRLCCYCSLFFSVHALIITSDTNMSAQHGLYITYGLFAFDTAGQGITVIVVLPSHLILVYRNP